MASLKLALVVDAENPIIGDVYLKNGTVEITSTLGESVAQELFCRFRMFLGDWFLDPTIGIPYLQLILGEKTPVGVIAQIYRNVITGCPGVKTLTQFSLSGPDSNRQISVAFVCTLTDGTILTSADYGAFVLPGVT